MILYYKQPLRHTLKFKRNGQQDRERQKGEERKKKENLKKKVL